MKKRFWSMALVLAMVLMLLPVGALADTGTLNYLDKDGKKQTYSGNYIEVGGGTTKWNSSNSWYVVSGSVTIHERITVTGDISLLLKDNCTLNAKKTITVGDGSSLTIYAQSDGEGAGSIFCDGNEPGISVEGDGCLTLNNGTIKKAVSFQCISNSGTFTMNGGKINTGSNQAIVNGNIGVFYANGGTVTSTNESAVQNYGTLAVEADQEGTTFDCTVSNQSSGTIAGGTFTDTLKNYGIIYATANVTGSITYNNGSIITYKIGETEYAKQFVKTGNKAVKPTAPTKEGYIFDAWYTDAACTKAFDFENAAVTGNITLYANFREATHKTGSGTTNYRLLHIYVEGEGTVEPSGTVMVRDGSDKTFTLTPAAGYEVGDVVVNHKSLGAVTSFTLKDIDTDTSVEVTFVKTGSAVVTDGAAAANPTTGAAI